MRAKYLAVGLIGALLAGAPCAHAQALGREAVVAAAHYVRTNSGLRELPKEQLVLDRRVADVAGKLTVDRARTETAAILQALDASRMGMKEREVTCSGSEQKDCRMLGQAKGLVALSEARVEGEKASVDAHIWWESKDKDEPVASKHLIIDLERVEGTWRVKGDRPLRIS